MAALIDNRDTPELATPFGMEHAQVAVDNDEFFKGALIVLDTNGKFAPGATAVGLIAVGRGEDRLSTGASNTRKVRARSGIFRWANSAGADELTSADIGEECYVVDDQTVAKTSATNTRSVAGKVYDVDAAGVWVVTKFPL